MRQDEELFRGRSHDPGQNTQVLAIQGLDKHKNQPFPATLFTSGMLQKRSFKVQRGTLFSSTLCGQRMDKPRLLLPCTVTIITRLKMTQVMQSPCITCRHTDIFDASDICHAVKYFDGTGYPSTPPRRYPGKQNEKQEKPAARPPSKPLINKQRPLFTNVHLQALAVLQPAREKK